MYGKIDLGSIDLTQSPSAEEPQRQYYFMAKAKECVKESSEQLGRPLFASVKTFG